MSDEAPDFNEAEGKKASKVLIVLTVFGVANVLAVILVTIMIVLMPLIAVAALKDSVFGLLGLKDEAGQELIDQIPDDMKKEMEKYREDLEQALDCSNRPVDERRPGENCIEGLIGANDPSWSPIPDSANWLVPVWVAAGKRYKVPWELLAALNGARTSFGYRICDSATLSDGGWQLGRGNDPFLTPQSGSSSPGGEGVGFYRMPARLWLQNSTDAGYAKSKPRGSQSLCDSSESPAQVYKEFKKPLKKLADVKNDDLGGDPVDAVDATFAMARNLAREGAWNKTEWNYKGSGPGKCSITDRVGQISYPPIPPMGAGGGPGARIGFNKMLKIPRWAPTLAANYRSNKGKYKPRRDDDPLDEQLGYNPIPKPVLVKLLKVAWTAFGARGDRLNANVTANFAQIGLESGGRPYILQGHIGDVNDNNPAGGLFQFIPGTFETWRVAGYEDRFNPLDNILAAVNAQVNSDMGYILSGASGWSPNGGSNPYVKGGKSTLVSSAPPSGELKAVKYKGKEQNDPISKAVRNNADGTSDDCYVAVIHDWYKLIKKYPPDGAIGVSGPVRQRIVKIAQAELAQKPSESGQDNWPLYRSGPKSGKTAPYAFARGTAGQWCQAFAAWVWYQAGIKDVTKIAGARQSGGMNLPVGTATMTAAAQAGQYGMKYKTSNPLPGDMLFYSSTHVELVTKVANGKVVETIGGNTSDAVTKVAPPVPGYTHFVSPPASAGKSLYQFADQRGSAKAGEWIRVGASAYDENTRYNKPKYKGNTYAELLVAGANAGLASKSLASVFGINSKEWVGMPMGTELLLRFPGKKKVYRIYKIDNGSGQRGETKFKIDLSLSLVRKMGFNSVYAFGRRTVEVALVQRDGGGSRGSGRKQGGGKRGSSGGSGNWD